MAGVPALSTAGANSGAGLDHTGNSHLSQQCSYAAFVGSKFYEYVATIEMIYLLATDEQARKALFADLEGSDFVKWQQARGQTLSHTYEFLKERWFGDRTKSEQARARAKESLENWETHRSNFLHSLKDALFSYYNEIVKRYKDCGVAYAFATVSTDGAFLLGELAVGAGAVSAASKLVKSLKFFLRHTPDGVEVRVVNPKGGSFIKTFRNKELEAKYGAPQDNHTGVVRRDPNRPVTSGRQLTKAEYEALRKKTPSAAQRAMVNRGQPVASAANPVPDQWVRGLERTGPLQADHIVPMKTITQMDGFSDLTVDNQVAVLNHDSNFTGLSASANASKGAQSYSQWTQYQKGVAPDFSPIPVNPQLRSQMIARSQKLEPELQEEIYRRLREQQAKNGSPAFRDK